MKASEKLGVYGTDSLSDLEVFEVIVGHTKGARALWDRFDLSELNSVLPNELTFVEGVGPVVAKKICAAIELGKRLQRAKAPQENKEAIRRPSTLVNFLKGHLRGLTQESFMIVGLDSRQKVLLARTIAIGSLSQVDVHPRELFRPLIRSGAHSCILAHNHPSGDPEPSEADIELTIRMVEVGQIVGIPVLDHVVFTNNSAVSLAALGLVD